MDFPSALEVALKIRNLEGIFEIYPSLSVTATTRERFNHAPSTWEAMTCEMLGRAGAVEIPETATVEEAIQAAQKLKDNICKGLNELDIDACGFVQENEYGAPYKLLIALDATEESENAGHTVTTPYRPKQRTFVRPRNPKGKYSDNYIPTGDIIIDDKAAWRIDRVQRTFVDEDLASYGAFYGWEGQHIFEITGTYLGELTTEQVEELEKEANAINHPGKRMARRTNPFRQINIPESVKMPGHLVRKEV